MSESALTTDDSHVAAACAGRFIYDPSPVTLDPSGPLREPTRPEAYRGPDFYERFDATTLLFDAFLDAAGTTAVLIGPPFANLIPAMEEATFQALPSGRVCPAQLRYMDRTSQARVRVPSGTTHIALKASIGAFKIALRRSQTHLFAGKRVMFTLSKDNEISWIKDWVRYGRDVHGADAVLIYDNASQRYGADELLAALGELADIDAVGVVRWPFKYGPQGINELDCWDSDFCQHGALEHARWMFLERARGVMNSDIDELVASDRGESVFAAAERSYTGLVRYAGVWVYGFSDRAGAGNAHSYAEFDHYLRPEHSVRPHAPDGFLNTKWTVVPSRCPAHFQWTTHRIYGWRGLYSRLSNQSSFLYRHYREINTNWLHSRSGRVAFDAAKYAPDPVMVRNFARVRWDR